ncbi:hypothetical protein C8F01DRAFT_1145081 [Mycena amicta]|nr:hypothetical protein C8F01DRAFT_1145081 [Mycena amicta]
MAAEDPRLPPELERKIFEITARVHPQMRYTLLFVARRVLIWIEPTLYRTLVFENRHRLSQLLTAKSSEFFAKTTRHVSVGNNASEDAVGVLELCTGVTHLALDLYEINHQVLRSPFRALQQLRRLALYPGYVLLAAARDVSRVTVPLFPSLTHLHLFDDNGDNLKLLCAALPALTHLAVNGGFAWPTADILADCKKLTLLVLVASEQYYVGDIEAELAVLADLADPRVVVTWYKTWDEGVLDCYSYWDVAGDFAARKRQGLIEESCFLAERD